MNRKSSTKLFLIPKKGEINKMTEKHCKKQKLEKMQNTHFLDQGTEMFLNFLPIILYLYIVKPEKNIVCPSSDYFGQKL